MKTDHVEYNPNREPILGSKRDPPRSPTEFQESYRVYVGFLRPELEDPK